MQAIIVTLVSAIIIAAFVIYCTRKDRRAARSTAMSPGPRIREMTAARPRPAGSRRLASGSQRTLMPVVNDFNHVPTDYGTYTPAQVDTVILERADTMLHPVTSVCAEMPTYDTFSGHHDSSFDGGSDGGSSCGDGGSSCGD